MSYSKALLMPEVKYIGVHLLSEFGRTKRRPLFPAGKKNADRAGVIFYFDLICASQWEQ